MLICILLTSRPNIGKKGSLVGSNRGAHVGTCPKGLNMDLASKLKAIRRNEGVTQAEFCELVGLSISSYKKYESAMFEMGFGALGRVANHPRFFKYTLWLMTDRTAPDCGQVSPE